MPWTFYRFESFVKLLQFSSVLVLLLVALWFILRGICCMSFRVSFFPVFFSPFTLRLPRFGKRELISVLFVRLFGLCLFRFVGFLFLLGSGKGCGLWLWHSLDFSLTFFFTLGNLCVSKSNIYSFYLTALQNVLCEVCQPYKSLQMLYIVHFIVFLGIIDFMENKVA